jgi:plastocyanin
MSMLGLRSSVPFGGTARSVFLLLLLAGCGWGGPAYAPPAKGAAIVEMSTWLSFEPASITVKAGDTVEWRNTSPFTHTVTSTAAAEAFDSGAVKPGQVFRHTFTQAGAYRYVCKPHEEHDMRGTVVVEPKAP